MNPTRHPLRVPRQVRVHALAAALLLTPGTAPSQAASTPPATPVLSEFVADNDGSFPDGLEKPSDWIELYNPTPSTVDLAGWRLRDGTQSWTFPSVTLPPGGFLVVFASDQKTQPFTDPAGYLHASFKLDADGEPLALLRPDGSTAWEFPEPGPQRRGISFGLTQTTTPLTTFATAARLLVPTAPIPESWRADPDFNDTAWIPGQASAGYGTPFTSISGTAAYRVHTATPGNQDYGGALGMDFVVHRPVVVTSLGCFDDGGEGLSATIRVDLWRRNDAGTPSLFSDDTGSAVLSSMTFTSGDAGVIEEGSRFKPLPAPLTLPPGAYTIVAQGYGPAERNGNLGGGSPPDPWETQSGDGALSFVGGGRYGTANSFPRTVDGGPSNRYAAGTFKFAGPDDPLIRTRLPTAAASGNPSAWMRVRFDIADPALFDGLQLRLAYDDGCVAWINGAEAARRFAPSPLAYNSAATRRSRRLETVSMGAGVLLRGPNVLAVHGLNSGLADGEFFFGTALAGVSTRFEAPRFFSKPSPGAPNPPQGAPGYVASPRFSVERGFKTAPFDLILTHPRTNAVLHYTLDGSTPSARHGTTYSAPIRITSTTVIRAMASLDDLEPSPVETHSFLFADDVAVQSSNPPPGYPARWTDSSNGGTYTADYGMIDPGAQPARYARAAGDPAFTPAQARAALARSLQALPVLSVVTETANLFDPTTGIYLHPGARGEAWERPVSVEYLTADGVESWQAGAGIHVMGLTSRSLQVTPKLNLMLVFNQTYGDAWLRQPFFGADGPDQIKRIALRSNTRDGWLAEFHGFGTATYLLDGFAKDSARDSGEPATRHRFCHLFLNGLYWGVYNPTERPESHWAETTFGGEDEDYDVLDLCCGNQLESGDFTEWRQLLSAAQTGFRNDAAFQAIQGNNPQGQRNPALKRLLGVDSFIGFAINGYYHASVDWPGNFFAVFDNAADRTQGWRFVTWDTDLGLPNFQVSANKVTPPEGFSHAWWQNSPGVVDAGLRQNAEYRMRLADRVYAEFFHEGAYSTNATLARWRRLRDAIQPGLYAESARWGDYRPGGLRTVQEHWLPRVNGTAATTWFARRNAAVLQQLRAAGLYPAVDPPEFSRNGGQVPAGAFLEVTNPNALGQVVYTLDGQDPRTSPSATLYDAPIPIRSPLQIRARVRNGTVWSALHAASFFPAQDFSGLQITEILFHPPDAGGINGDEFEFLELFHGGNQVLDLGGAAFQQGIQYAFTNQTLLHPGQYWVIARTPDVFRLRYPGVPLHGTYEGKLDNRGETLTLVGRAGTPIVSLTYSDAAPWPAEADNTGLSLQRMALSPTRTESRAWLAATPTPGGPLPPDLNDSDADGIPDGWESRHGFDPRSPDAEGDADGDGRSNWEEFISGTNPRDALDTLRLQSLGTSPLDGEPGAVLGFLARSNKTYTILQLTPSEGGPWVALESFDARPVDRFLRITNAIPRAGDPRFFRLATPRLP